ncbi:unnamed protein product [Cunninghamella blakesleeana]
MEGLDDSKYSISQYKFIYLQLDQPTHFIYWYTNQYLTTKFNQISSHLSSLHVYIEKEYRNDPSSNQQSQNIITIYMKSMEINNAFEPRLNIKKLVLPTTALTNLIKLKIDFEYEVQMNRFENPVFIIIDEHTFETIHQSCPLLESLSVENFYMNISNDYLNYYDSKKDTVAADHLKCFHIKSIFHHLHCFQYFADKYPHLESLSFYINVDEISLKKIKSYTITILNTLLQFPLLKKLSYITRKNDIQLWSSFQFFSWLNQHPKQLMQLDYPFPLTEYECQNIDNFNGMIDIYYKNNNKNSINNNNDIKPSPQQYLFLNYLTSLSIYIDYAFDLVFTFLSKNRNTIIASTSLKELKMKERFNDKNSYIRFYDWLDIFPNLISFSILQFSGNVIDNSPFFNSYNKDYIYEKDYGLSNKLHQLIKYRKQQQIKQQHDTSNINNKDTNCYYYKLNYIEISSCCIWFENGFDEALRKCSHLKELKLSRITFINLIRPFNEIHFDLSNLYLDFLKVYSIYFSPFNNVKSCYTITVLNIYESTLGRSRSVIEKNQHSKGDKDDDKQFSLNLKCKFIEGLYYGVE